MDSTPAAFESFAKIARLNRECIATEKIDGTNAQIFIHDDGPMLVGSRTRWITPADDNHGFARWAFEHADELRTLGPGRHFGEWWGSGIQRGYGLAKGEKRFSLFNVGRWGDDPQSKCSKCSAVSGRFFPDDCGRCGMALPAKPAPRPACCGVVPELARGIDIRDATERALATLRERGSLAAPGFMRPEGVVIFHSASGALFKVTLEKDGEPKGTDK